MDIKAYISSGIIEMYALGIASEAEARELENLCIQYPEIKQALLEAQEGMERFAQANASTPPAESKNRILQTLQQEGLLSDRDTQSDSIASSTSEIIPIHDSRQRRSSTAVFVAAAAIILLILGAIYHLYTVNKLKTEILLMATQQRSLNAELTQYRDRADTLRQQLAIVAKPGIRKLDLQGVPGHEGRAAAIYWNTTTKEVYLAPNQLAVLPKGKQYQLWAIIDGKPVSAGVFNQGSLEAVQQMKTVQRAEMFAITIEKEGGAEIPSLDQMVVAGKI
ncbi:MULTISPECIES: anti-sigma factor [Olivibacter]|uniref:Anti-sigma factor domain-containing protein n=1 Tax=Olivibacter oleidegradans TaxID=760123 RepID=A0ABV6HJA0_9SPHI|nr:MULTISPECIES: anti-sigma factor [Olivibacter]MDM8176888.1 anti-sigma factor [Olivibacter sp. 47]QEL00651.1 anti-sigma factor [Olivibacter sp. LS-1]